MTNGTTVVKPYKTSDSGKKEQVTHMFNAIAKSYDVLNHTLSLGIDKIWRRKSIALLMKNKPDTVIDIATGTADFAIEMAKHPINKIVGFDISENMLAIGQEKVNKLNLQNQIAFKLGDSENISYPDNSFDAATVAFGVRNFENLLLGMTEIYRVLKPGGILIVLELSEPEHFPMKQLYSFYFKKILPFIGKKLSKHSTAYNYLPESVANFPYGNRFLDILTQAGFVKTNLKRFSFGIATLYSGTKKINSH